MVGSAAAAGLPLRPPTWLARYGMLTAGALAHNMGWASSPAGPGPNALAVVVVSLGFCIAVGFFYRKTV